MHNALGITLGRKMPASERPSPLKSDLAFAVTGTAKLSTTLAPKSDKLVMFAAVPMPRVAKPAQMSAMSAGVPAGVGGGQNRIRPVSNVGLIGIQLHAHR